MDSTITTLKGSLTFAEFQQIVGDEGIDDEPLFQATCPDTMAVEFSRRMGELGGQRNDAKMKNHWSDKSIVEIWNEYDAMERALASPLSDRMIELANLTPGMRVLDIATGRGEPAIPAAKRVGENGCVVGIDVAASMLEMARSRAIQEGVRNLSLQVCDAEVFQVPPEDKLDAALARWCLMYFSNPIAALRSARQCMKPQAKLVVAVWAEPARVHYHSFPRDVLRNIHNLPPENLDTPGTFAYSNVERIHTDLKLAGLKLESVEEMFVHVMESDSAEKLIQWTRAFGLNRLLMNLPAEIQIQWENDMLRQAEDYRVGDKFRLGGVTRIFVATPDGRC